MVEGRSTTGKDKKSPGPEQNKTRAVRGMILFLSSAFLVFTSLLGDKSLFQLHRLQIEKERLAKENQRQARENGVLREKILAAREDLFVVEKIAREDLGLVKKNEVVYLFDPEEIERGPGAGPPDRAARKGAP